MKCPHCNKRYKNVKELEKHPKGGGLYKCVQCSKALCVTVSFTFIISVVGITCISFSLLNFEENTVMGLSLISMFVLVKLNMTPIKLIIFKERMSVKKQVLMSGVFTSLMFLFGYSYLVIMTSLDMKKDYPELSYSEALCGSHYIVMPVTDVNKLCECIGHVLKNREIANNTIRSSDKLSCSSKK